MKLFSIVTVCLNAEKIIEKTIQSVLKQDYDNFEYIIQDGASSDKTIRIAESFAPAFAEKGISFRIISQRDQGIYDAMNKAVKEAEGEWILFMNAGDCFIDGTVLSKISANTDLDTSDVVYGDVVIQEEGLYLYIKARELESIRFGQPFCHQSAFTRRTLLDEIPFSLQYRMCSDFLFYLRIYLEGKTFSHIPMAISLYDTNGLSSDSIANRKERLRILEQMPIRDEEAIQKIKSGLEKEKKEKFMHEHFWKFIPKKLRQIRRNRLRKKSGWKTAEEFFALDGSVK